jgi:pimeloyl-ACP methyl ester carboxylesterase
MYPRRFSFWSLVLTPLVACLSVEAAEGLTREQAQQALQKAYQARVAELKTQRAEEVSAKLLTFEDKKMPWLEKSFNLTPEGKRALWISMHGGGGAPASVNDQQWRNQIRLYAPEEGIVVAPRAPTNNWNLWHESHIDPLFSRLIDDFVAVRGVDPNHIYLMGYSAGGDGVWQLAPRMADRFAAVAMMAGHPNGVNLQGVRNLPFAIFVGGEDAAYQRNKVVPEKIAELDALQKADPEGYVHWGKVYPGLPHWMNGQDAEALPWMKKYSRQPWPKKVVWVQTGTLHTQFYWLQVPAGSMSLGQKISATVTGQVIKLEGDLPKGLTLHLSDALLNLNQPVVVMSKEQKVFEGLVPRSLEAIQAGLQERCDLEGCSTALLKINL